MSTARAYYLALIRGERKGVCASMAIGVLALLSGVYRVGSFFARAYASIYARRLPVPVISVGNVTWGGTGKTPLVEYIAAHYGHTQKRAAILMRGYGNDEDMLLSRTLPSTVVLSNKNRYRAFQEYANKKTLDVCILDDGFQHVRLRRDLDIVVINCRDPWGNGKLIPCGPLRESIAGIARADMIVLSHASSVQEDERTRIKDVVARFTKKTTKIVEASHVPVSCYRASMPDQLLSCAFLKEKKVFLFAGIGTPTAFEATVREIGAEIVGTYWGADHYHWTERDGAEIRARAQERGAALIVTTEKDLMRCEKMMQKIIDPYIVRIEIVLQHEEKDDFDHRLDRLLGD